MKKIIYILIGALVLFSTSIDGSTFFAAKKTNAAGTTYYVDCNVSASGDGLTWATAKKTINAAVALAGPGDTVEISGGSYNEAVNINHANGSLGLPITFQGSQAVGHNSEVIIDRGGAASNGIAVNKNYITIKNLRIKNVSGGLAGIYISSNMNNTVVDSVKIWDCYISIYTDGTDVLIRNSELAGPSTSSYILDLHGSSSGQIVNTIFRNSNINDLRYIRNRSTGAWSFDHITMGACAQDCFRNESTSSVIITNSILFGPTVSGKYTINNVAGGTVNLKNSLALPNSFDGATLFNNVTDGGGNVYQDPHLAAYSRSGYFTFVVDDSDLDYAEQVASILNPLGMYVTFYVIQTDIVLKTNWQQRLQAFIAAGNEIGSHTYSHSKLNLTTAFSVTGTGTSPTIQIDRANNRIRLHDTESGDQDITGFREMTLNAIISEINGKSRFSAGVLTTNLNGIELGESLAELAPASCSSAKTLLLDLTTDGSQGYYKVEIFDSKAWLQAQLPGYTVKSFACPWDTSSASQMIATQNAGYTSSRAEGLRTLTSLPIYNLKLYTAALLLAGGSDNFAKNTASYLVNTQQQAYWMQVLSHHTSELTLDQIRMLAAMVLSQPDIIYNKTVSGVANEITTSGLWSTADGGVTWTRSYNDASNYHPLANSPVIDAGLDTNIDTDYIGKQRYDDPDVINTGSAGSYSKNYVDIGAYEYVTPPTPRLVSSTHPVEGTIYSNHNVSVSVTNTSSTTHYYCLLDQNPSPSLSAVLAGVYSASGQLDVTIPEDGQWYIHVAAINLDNDSSTTYGTFSVKVGILTELPATGKR